MRKYVACKSFYVMHCSERACGGERMGKSKKSNQIKPDTLEVFKKVYVFLLEQGAGREDL